MKGSVMMRCRMGMPRHMPLIAMLFAQFIYAVMYLLSKAAISSGIRPSVFVVYRQAIATLVLAPFAYFFERKKSPSLTWNLICKIFIVSTCGLTMTLNLHYIGLNYISATFATAVSNTIPTMVFIIAVLLRIEKLGLRERHGWAKVLGTAVVFQGLWSILSTKALLYIQVIIMKPRLLQPLLPRPTLKKNRSRVLSS
ncbi:UNVERIFIED_CONTAM: WAT1-related protein [Sesamum angustifolium]|uniref:WAT1-related protein n=1 Tax=Sesamum angustifolium TaxID=2727405 RepID=A0AAW2L8D0_9LAMI